MAKLSFYAAILLLCTSGAMMMGMVAGDRCKEDIGACGNEDCNTRCGSAHQGGTGKCIANLNGGNDCWCYYDCPPLKTCEGNAGGFGTCENSECEFECVAKFPGKGAVGFCISVGDPIYLSCHCRYFC